MPGGKGNLKGVGLQGGSAKARFNKALVTGRTLFFFLQDINSVVFFGWKEFCEKNKEVVF